MIRAAVFGATGYTGLELIRLLARHPDVEIALISSETYAGSDISKLYPHLQGFIEKKLSLQSLSAVTEAGCDIVFFALPHGIPMTLMREVTETSLKVIDLSADFRLQRVDLFEKWYETRHHCPDILPSFVYGLPE
ncbi:MAG: N-acetyl-gamma-glutamyl-phosphate reductase, partial [Nitrospinota bacterium]